MNSKEFYHTRKIATPYHTRDNTKSIVLYLTTEHKIYHLSHSVYVRTLSTLLILAVCEARVRYEPRDGFAYHRVYVVSHRSAEPEDLAFDSSWGLTNFTLSHAHDKANKYL